jgi:hypothetical protein
MDLRPATGEDIEAGKQVYFNGNSYASDGFSFSLPSHVRLRHNNVVFLVPLLLVEVEDAALKEPSMYSVVAFVRLPWYRTSVGWSSVGKLNKSMTWSELLSEYRGETPKILREGPEL